VAVVDSAVLARLAGDPRAVALLPGLLAPLAAEARRCAACDHTRAERRHRALQEAKRGLLTLPPRQLAELKKLLGADGLEVHVSAGPGQAVRAYRV
jgi:hypothetical protein